MDSVVKPLPWSEVSAAINAAEECGWLRAFVAESNRIEGIEVTSAAQVAATSRFLRLTELSAGEVEALAQALQPGVRLRSEEGLDVMVGDHVPPPGGKEVTLALSSLVQLVNEGITADNPEDPWGVHCEFENLHPLTDGNGRTGRALWLWQYVRLLGRVPPEFLRPFYYMTLSRYDGQKERLDNLEQQVEELKDQLDRLT